MSDQIITEQPKSEIIELKDKSNKNETNIDIQNNSQHKSHNWDKRLGSWTTISDTNSFPDPESLSLCKKLIIIRQFKLLNNNDSGNRYLIKDENGSNIYLGIETSGGCDNVCCCGRKRPFIMTLVDKNHNKAITMDRPLKFGNCGIFPFCLQQIKVNINNEPIGRVKEKYNPFRFHLRIRDENDETLFKVIGPQCEFSCIGDDIHFNIYRKDCQSKCGFICKKSEFTIGGHIFNIEFPIDSDFKQKVLIISATILIDYYYYEQPFHEHKYHRLTMSESKSLTPFPLAIDYTAKCMHQNK